MTQRRTSPIFMEYLVCAVQFAEHWENGKPNRQTQGPCFQWNWVFPGDSHLCLLQEKKAVQIPVRWLWLLSYLLGNFKIKIKATVLTTHDAVHGIFLAFHFFPLRLLFTWYSEHLKNMSTQELKQKDETAENRRSKVTMFCKGESRRPANRNHVSREAWLIMPLPPCHRAHLWLPSSVRNTGSRVWPMVLTKAQLSPGPWERSHWGFQKAQLWNHLDGSFSRDRVGQGSLNFPHTTSGHWCPHVFFPRSHPGPWPAAHASPPF